MKLKLADQRKSYRSTKIMRSETLEIHPERQKKKSREDNSGGERERERERVRNDIPEL